jgi:uncharacterized protein (TIGR01777 family)
MKIVIPGGSGQVGTMVARAFHGEGHEVTVLSRRPRTTPWHTVQWDGARFGPWLHSLDGADVLLNLTGRSVNCRYTAANRREILDSRVQSTHVLGQALGKLDRPPRVWLQASTATIYAHRYDAANDEFTGIIGGAENDAPDTWRFSIDVARAWEQAFDEVSAPATRKVILRSAMTMSADSGGVFDALLALVRRGQGGRIGDGRQFMSWVHEDDFIGTLRWLIAHDEIDGIFNIASPNPMPNDEFMRVLREAWGIRVGVPTAQWMLEIGALLLRTESELVLKSRRVVPRRLLERGFVFVYPHWPDAARDLCRKWLIQRGGGAYTPTRAQPSPRPTPHGATSRCGQRAARPSARRPESSSSLPRSSSPDRAARSRHRV